VHDDDLYSRLRGALITACASIGVQAGGAQLLRLHSNAVFHLPRPDLIARISTERHGRQRIAVSLAVTAWLAEQGFPTVTPAHLHPVQAGPFLASFWHYVETANIERTAAQLAPILRELHTMAEPPFDLPGIDMPGVLEAAAETVLAHPKAFTADDQSFLTDRIADLEQQWGALCFALPSGLIHGDAHPNNLLPTTTARVLIGDWDSTCLGPREWDLIQPHYFHRRFSTTRADLDRAARVYGWDVRGWTGLDTLIAVREITGLGSYIRTASMKPGARQELTYRIATLRAGDTHAAWHSPQAL
jgi:aminoglycoside phosphotransferase (APT) family kinase protein